MNNYPPAYPPNDIKQQGNKKLWIILGLVIGVLVIVMGGCVACGALIGLSSLNNHNFTTAESDPESTKEPRSDSRRSGSGDSGNLAGNTWRGTLSCDDGDSVPAVFRFAESGNVIYEYQTQGGSREAELTTPGQTLRFVPPEGGVTTIVFDAIQVSSDRMNLTMSVSRERTGGGTLTQSRASITTDATLSGDELEVETTFRSQSTTSQPGIMIPGDEQVATCRGKLPKE